MKARTIKSLGKTGRVSRKRAGLVARELREGLPAKKTSGAKKKIAALTTASGRGEISFHLGNLDAAHHREVTLAKPRKLAPKTSGK